MLPGSGYDTITYLNKSYFSRRREAKASIGIEVAVSRSSPDMSGRGLVIFWFGQCSWFWQCSDVIMEWSYCPDPPRSQEAFSDVGVL